MAAPAATPVSPVMDFGSVGDSIVNGLQNAIIDILLNSAMVRLVMKTVGAAVAGLVLYWIVISAYDRYQILKRRRARQAAQVGV